MKKLCCTIMLSIFIFCCACNKTNDIYHEPPPILSPTDIPASTISIPIVKETPAVSQENKNIIFILESVGENETSFAVLGIEQNKQYELPEKLKVNDINLEQYFFKKDETQMLIQGEYYQFDDIAVGDQIQILSNQEEPFTATIVSLKAFFEESTAAIKVFVTVQGVFNPQHNYIAILSDKTFEVPQIPLDDITEIDLNCDGKEDKIIINPKDSTDWKIYLSDGNLLMPKTEEDEERIFCIADIDGDGKMEIFFEDTFFHAAWLCSIDNIEEALCAFPSG